MAIVAGIDEAGLGPVLGPLVVSAAVFGVPDDQADQSLWRLLAGAVTRKASRRSSALAVADSKALRVRTEGVIHLERGVLAALGQIAPPPTSLREYLRRAAPETIQQMQGYPWYADADLPLPRQADPTDLSLRANALGQTMAGRGIAFRALRVECVLEGTYNRLVGATRNKSVALFGVVSRLIAWVFSTYAHGAPARIVVDRLGGRMRYLHTLMRMFPQAAIRILDESERHSAYLVEYGRRAAEISFQVNAEAASLPAALASMASKYTRELLMELLNAWWMARLPGLKPTAGYHTDGLRFLKEIDPYVSAQGIDKSLLVRCR